MSGIIPYINFIVLVITGLAGIAFALLLDILGENIKHRLSKRLASEPPSRKPAWMWVAFYCSILFAVLGGAYTAAGLLPKPVVYITSPVEVGRHATVTVKTVAGTDCAIQYVTPSGSESESKELGDKEADTNGICAWCWQISPSTTPGRGQVVVTVGDARQRTYEGMIEIIPSAPGP